MEFVKGASFGEWLAWPLARKLKSSVVAVGSVVLMLLVAWLFASIFVFSKSALLSWWDARWNERAIAELEGKQVQRHVDASTVTHQPYRYLFDKCLDPWAVHHADGVTYLGCRGNVRILAGDDTVLGRGDTAIFKGKGGADVAHAVIFGDWRDTFDEADLRAK